MRKWRIEDSEELYNVTGWGTSYLVSMTEVMLW